MQQKKLNAIFTIAKITMDKSRYENALKTAKKLYEDYSSLSYNRQLSLTLDYAKIIHEY